MKKAKVMLSAIAVVALVGTGLAMKAQKFGHTLIYFTTNPAGTECNTSQSIPNASFTGTQLLGTTPEYSLTSITTPCALPPAQYFKAQ